MKPHRVRVHGFTLVEMSVSMGIAVTVTACTLVLFIQFARSYNETTLMRTASARASLGLERIVYGVNGKPGLREAFRNSATLSFPGDGWKLGYTNAGNLSLQYNSDQQTLVDQSGKLLCTNVIFSSCSNFPNAGCLIVLTVAEKAGGRILTSSATTYVQYRN